MKKLKIDFVDFWPGFNKTDNYFYRLLNNHYNVVIDKKPELIFYSSFGYNYLNYNCKRIFYTGENRRPDFTSSDFSFSFDYNSNKRHFRLPLYSIYIDDYKMHDALLSKISENEARRIWDSKTKFCCMIVSNPKAKKRIDFFKNLSKIKHVDSGGAVLNNIGGRVKDKIDFIKDYKFVFAFENAMYDGYTTEKILEPLLVNSIPIYWGNNLLANDFNSEKYIHYNDFLSEDLLIEKLLKIDGNPELAINMLKAPVFSKNRLTIEKEKEQVLCHIINTIESKRKPIAQTYKKYLHNMKLFINRLKKSRYNVLKKNRMNTDNQK